MHDLAVLLVSHNGAGWIRPCLTSVLEHAGGCDLEVVVVSNADDGTAEIVQGEFPGVRLIRCDNHGFAHANNRALLTCNSRYVLFLNVDTEVVSGTFGELVDALDARPAVGMAGVRQVTPDGAIAPTIRRFPNALRALCDALAFERLPIRASWSGERELRRRVYESEQTCDWTSGSFLVIQRRVLQAVGLMDERFFLYSEEPDLCLRGKKGGWEMHHLPVMTIVHHIDQRRVDPRLASQDAYARLQFSRKHFSTVHHVAYAAALALGYTLRAAAPGHGRAETRAAARRSLRTLLGIDAPPFGPPPSHSLSIASGSN
jgi:N-acetylglucosaminyl-diphospho-decaprenol L-rhamnosyltransferase